jgi:MFS family permease
MVTVVRKLCGGTIAALVLAGSLSDRVGRRPVLLAGLALSR